MCRPIKRPGAGSYCITTKDSYPPGAFEVPAEGLWGIGGFGGGRWEKEFTGHGLLVPAYPSKAALLVGGDGMENANNTVENREHGVAKNGPSRAGDSPGNTNTGADRVWEFPIFGRVIRSSNVSSWNNSIRKHVYP
jgi:hypothetical protein